MDDFEASLKAVANALHPLDEGLWSEFLPLWSEVKFKRKQLITRAGSVEQYLYFVVSGVQRAYCLHQDKDVTLVFSYAPSFSGIVDSFFLQQPSGYFLETLTDSTLVRISYTSLHQLMETNRALETWVRMAMTLVLRNTLTRQIELAAFSAEERFTTLLRRSPQVLRLIPHKYLASYIGVDPTNFSKLLNSVRL
jgi:CRP-like cAMP-binding protein